MDLPQNLLEQLLYAHILLRVLLHDLGDSHLEVLLGHMDAPLPEGVHPRLSARALDLRPGAAAHLLSNLPQVDSSGQVHPSAVNLQDIQPILILVNNRIVQNTSNLPSILARRWEFNLSVNSAGSEQGRVQDVDSVGGHDHLDVLGGLKAVQLIEELQHGPLDLAVSAAAGLDPGAPDAVNLVHKDDGGGVLPGHHEQLPHHPAALSNELLDQL